MPEPLLQHRDSGCARNYIPISKISHGNDAKQNEGDYRAVKEFPFPNNSRYQEQQNKESNQVGQNGELEKNLRHVMFSFQCSDSIHWWCQHFLPVCLGISAGTGLPGIAALERSIFHIGTNNTTARHNAQMTDNILLTTPILFSFCLVFMPLLFGIMIIFSPVATTQRLSRVSFHWRQE